MVQSDPSSGRRRDRSPGTSQTYRDRLDNHVLTAIGALRLREVTVSRVDRLLKTTREKHGVAVAKLTRTVLSGLMGLAARRDAIGSNPVRDAASIRSAGLRIGETSAITWQSLDLDNGILEVRGTVIRITGRGLIIKQKPKSKDGWRTIELPGWAVTMLRRRLAVCEPNEWGVIFTSPTGQIRDPSNTQGDLRAVFDRAGYPDLTSHTFRRTVATPMDKAGLSAR